MRFSEIRVDLRHAWRLARSSPGMTLVAAGILTVGIAITTTAFSFVNAAILRPLPFTESERLVAVAEQDVGPSQPVLRVSLATVEALRNRVRSFEHVGAYRTRSEVLSLGSTATTTVTVAEIDSNVFRVLSARPYLGPGLLPTDYRGRDAKVVVSDAIWRSTFGASGNVLGQLVNIGARNFRVVGVMPANFLFPERSDVWVPLRDTSAVEHREYSIVARLQLGISKDRARAEIRDLGNTLARESPRQYRNTRLEFHEDLVIRHSLNWWPALTLFFGCAAVLLLVATVNVSTLLLIQSTNRRGEMALRAALGASPSRLFRQSVTETASLAIASGAAAFLLAKAIVQVVMSAGTLANLPTWFAPGVDVRVFLFVLLLTTVVLSTVGLKPAREATRLDLSQAVKISGDASATGRATTSVGLRGVAGQVALSIALVTTSSLLAATYANVMRADPGYAQDSILTVAVNPGLGLASGVEDRLKRFRSLATAVSAHPEVRAVALRAGFTGYRYNGPDSLFNANLFRGSERTPANESPWRQSRALVVSSEYFAVMGLPILHGRSFSVDDVRDSASVVVLSASAARSLWQVNDVLGKTLRLGSNGPLLSVIGIVGDISAPGGGPDGLTVAPRPMIYLSDDEAFGTVPQLVVRTSGPPTIVAGSIGPIVYATFGAAPFTVRTPEDDQSSTIRILRIAGSVFGACALIATVLAGIGIHAVLVYGIARRAREVGIRLALGASREQVSWELVRDGSRYAAIGIVFGLILAAGVAYLLKTTLWGVSPFSPLLYLSCALVGAAIVALVAYLASLHIRRIDPVMLMRQN